MGGCLSAAAEEEDNSTPLIPQKPEPSVPRQKGGAGASPAPPRRDGGPPRGDDGPPIVLRFANAASAATDAVEVPRFTSAKRAPSSVFCKCGGPGARVKLLPCGHAELCLSCAQQEYACPGCGAAITDSEPSFRVAA
jgi:hypothetical protein